MATGAAFATAFFRVYILYALEHGAARPAAILGSLHSQEGAPLLEGGAFSRAVHQLLDAGLVLPALDGALELTPMGRRERESQRPVWERICAIMARLLAGDIPPPEPPDGGGVPQASRAPDRAPDEYRDRVVLAEVREAARRARDRDEPFGVVLAEIAVTHAQPVRARAMLQRTLRETLGRAASSFAPGTRALRYGSCGVCLVVPGEAVDAHAELLRARLLESLAAMSATVGAFAGARYAVRAAATRWTREVMTSGELLRLAESALATDAGRLRAA